MDLSWLALVVLASWCSDHIVQASENNGHFLNQWAVEIPGGRQHAQTVAVQNGYELVRPLKSLTDHYLLKRSDTPLRSRRSAGHHTRKLSEDDRVLYVAQQQVKQREKRERSDRAIARDIVARGEDPHDPELANEWYINSAGSDRTRRSGVRADLRVKDVWKKGITGKNVVVTILDDGIERTHPDLQPNYDPEASTDLNADDDDPMPRYDVTNENKHGTRCGGEVAMVANNGNCGTGIAFDSKIGGVRMLDGHVTDHLEADAISFNCHHIDIYSASWGPNDDGKTTEGPGRLVKKAFDKGIKEGRDGKGVIYVWASGNGGRLGDNCNSDGYTSSIYTLSISSATEFGHIPWYAEKCSSTMATTYSSGTSSEGKVTSADLRGTCTNSHSGTSAAAPMAAGITALLLEANPNLTWRDVQHIVAHTSRMEPLAKNDGWYKNAAGYCVNLAFGFGLMDALAAVELADQETWQNVGPQKNCTVTPIDGSSFPQVLSAGHQVEVGFLTDGCENQENEINFLEHIQVVVDIAYTRRGHLYMEVESPMGTITPLMLERKLDSSKKGFKEWPLMSVHTWGEKPDGVWKLRVVDKSESDSHGSVKGARLVLYGTKEQPKYRLDYPADCGALDEIATGDEKTYNADADGTGAMQEMLANLQSKLEDVDQEIKTNPNTEPSYLQKLLGNIHF